MGLVLVTERSGFQVPMRPTAFGLDDLAKARCRRALRRLQGEELPAGSVTVHLSERAVFALISPSCGHMACLGEFCERKREPVKAKLVRQPWELAA